MCVVCDEPKSCDRAAAIGPPLISLVGAHRPSAGRAPERRHHAESVASGVMPGALDRLA
jgi:hypothetical protein